MKRDFGVSKPSVNWRHSLDCREGLQKRIDQHFPSLTNIGDFNGVIDIRNQRYSDFWNQKCWSLRRPLTLVAQFNLKLKSDIPELIASLTLLTEG